MEQLKNRRLKQLTKEEQQWMDISSKAQQRLDELKDREVKLHQDLEELRSMPNTISTEKTRLQSLSMITNKNMIKLQVNFNSKNKLLMR